MDDVAAKSTFAPPCLYPDEILSQYKLLEPKEYITVRGQVTDLRPFEDKVVYGDLKGRDCFISFRCPPDKCPTEKHQNVVLGGYLTVKPSKIHKGLDVELQGEMVGSWEGTPRTLSEIIVPERSRPVKTPLVSYVRETQNQTDFILVIGTQRGLDDFRQASGIHVNAEVVNVSEVRKFITDTRKAMKKYQPKAIAVVRGGSDAGRAMNIWNSAKLIDWLLKTECLIYSAIGHSDGYVFLDQYADQAFISPTDLGHGLKNALKERNQDISLNEKYRQIDQNNVDLSRKIDDLRDEYGSTLSAIAAAHANELEKQRSRTRFFIWMTSMLLLGIIGFTSIVMFKEQIIALLS